VPGPGGTRNLGSAPTPECGVDAKTPQGSQESATTTLVALKGWPGIRLGIQGSGVTAGTTAGGHIDGKLQTGLTLPLGEVPKVFMIRGVEGSLWCLLRYIKIRSFVFIAHGWRSNTANLTGWLLIDMKKHLGNLHWQPLRCGFWALQRVHIPASWRCLNRVETV
jgi:hypothetical protein